MPEVIAKTAAVQGALRERPLPRLLQQLFRKQFTGYFVIADETRDENQVYLREGWPVHVCRPVDTDRLDNLLVEYGLVPADIVAQASTQVSEGQRLGDVLERMGALDKEKLGQVLKTQVMRKLTRLFFVADGTYAVYLSSHGFGEGGEHSVMRVDPRTVIYPGIRAAYDLPRATRELSRLNGQRFRLPNLSRGFVSALGIPPDDPTVEALRGGWMTIEDLDDVTSRPFEVRSVVLAMYYTDSLEREAIVPSPTDSCAPDTSASSRSSGNYRISRLSTDSGAAFDLGVPGASEPAKVPEEPNLASMSAPAPGPATAPVITVPFHAAAPPVVSAASPNPPQAAFAAPASGAVPMVTTPMVAMPAQRSSVVRAMRPTAKPAAAVPVPEAIRASIQEMFARLDKSTHFEILGVEQNASGDEISSAFVRAARQFHPDRLAGIGLTDMQNQAERILSRINEAVMVLQNPGRRAEYLASLTAGAPQAAQNLPSLLEAENLFLKGEVLLKKGDYVRAIEAFTSASKGNSDEPQYRAYLAWARFEDPRARKEVVVRETLKCLDGVLKERPKFARGHYWVGQLWKFLNESPKAEQAFRDAVEADPAFIEASRELRLIEMRRSKPTAKPSQPDPSRGGLMAKLWKK